MLSGALFLPPSAASFFASAAGAFAFFAGALGALATVFFWSPPFVSLVLSFLSAIYRLPYSTSSYCRITQEEQLNQ
jgi:hypothetical protein